MKLKLSYLFAAAALFFAATSFAQVDRSIGAGQYKRGKGNNKPVDFVEETAKYYKKELKLDDFQAAAVREIIAAEKDHLMELMNDREATVNERKDRAKAIYDRMDAKILPLLSEEQQKKYKELRKIEDEQDTGLESD
jgi:Spy/CpxP family protein refolding chaperone